MPQWGPARAALWDLPVRGAFAAFASAASLGLRGEKRKGESGLMRLGLWGGARRDKGERGRSGLFEILPRFMGKRGEEVAALSHVCISWPAGFGPLGCV